MKDVIYQGLLCGEQLRFTAIAGRALVEEARKIHSLSCTAAAALGRALLMTALLGSQLKNETDSVTAVIAGDGPGGNLVCAGRYGALVKGYATNPRVELPLKPNGKLDVGGYVGSHGKLTVIRDLSLKEPYIGLCNLVSGEIAQDFAQYFTVSEQQPSLVYLGVREEPKKGDILAAGGILVQPLPGCPEAAIDKITALAPFIEDISLRLSEGEELREILCSIFRQADIHFTGETEPRYLCDCSRERMEKALLSIGEAELRDMIATDGKAELTCHFCNSAYTFSREELIRLLAEAKKANG